MPFGLQGDIVRFIWLNLDRSASVQKEGCMANAMEHCHKPWWKRPPVWFVAIAVLLTAITTVIERTDDRTALPYSAFLDQIDADNVVGVTFQGVEITGRFKQRLAGTERDTFRTRVPDSGDPTLIPALHQHHAVIEAKPQSPWSSLLAHIPWPMLALLGFAIFTGLIRMMRGGTTQPGSTTSPMPAHGIIGLVSGLFAAKGRATGAAKDEEGKPKCD
jgi:hypothetical protein